MGYLDIIVYAAIAAFVLMRLWSVLGQRHDDEPQQPNPFVKPAPRSGADDEDGLLIRDKKKLQEDAVDESLALPPPILAPVGPAPASLAGGLAQIQAMDPAFDEKKFLQGAKAAFAMIVEDFAKGDLTRTGRLLAPVVLENFTKAIAARQAAGQTLECRIEQVKDADLVAVRLEGSRAFVTVRFTSHQINLLRDTAGAVLSGQPNHAEEVEDVWVLSRDLKAEDPNWMLVETKG